jgi:hypothetical protein
VRVIRRALLPAADALALVLFVVVGIREHEEGTAISLFVRNALPLLGTWFVASRFTGAYRRPGMKTLVRTWALAVPAALLVRTAWVGSPTGTRILVFLGVGLVFTLLFLLAGRGLVRVLAPEGALERPDVVR